MRNFGLVLIYLVCSGHGIHAQTGHVTPRSECEHADTCADKLTDLTVVTGTDDLVTVEIDEAAALSSLLQISFEKSVQTVASSQERDQALTPCGDAFRGKDLDIVLFGTDSYVWKLSAEYLGQGHPDEPRWAIAGRSAAELSVLYDTLPKKPQEIIIADLDNTTSLRALTARTRVILSFASSYKQQGGEALIQAAIRECAHYVDLTSDNAWKQSMMLKYQELSLMREVQIVQSSGLASVPAEVLAFLAAAELNQISGETADEVVVVFTKSNGVARESSIAAGMHIQTRHESVTDPFFLVDPDLAAQCRHAVTSLDGKCQRGYIQHLNATLEPTQTGAVDAPLLRQSLSNHLNSKGTCFCNVNVCQTTQLKDNLEAYLRALQSSALSGLQHGETFPRWVFEKGSLAVSVIARSDSSKKRVCYTMESEGDPGYLGAAKMSTEVAVAMALRAAMTEEELLRDSLEFTSANNITYEGETAAGFLTPVMLLGHQVLKGRLENADMGRLAKFTVGCPSELLPF